MSRKKIFFRADAGPEIGYGHFIRTLALADMLKEDFDCVFYTQTPTDYQKREAAAVCPLVSLPADDSRFDLFLDKLTGDEIVVLDNYFYTTDYQRKIKEKGCKLVCIDDMHDKHYISDVLISHGFVSSLDFDVSENTLVKAGVKWALLRKPFLKATDWEAIRSNSIVVSLGGTDPYHITERIVSQLLNLYLPYEITVVLGDKMFLSEENQKKVKVLHNLSANEMADLFDKSAMGLFSASTVCIEGLSCGLPMIVGYYVDNQETGYKKMLKEGIISPLGNLRESSEKDLLLAITKIHKLKKLDIHPETIRKNYINLFSKL